MKALDTRIEAIAPLALRSDHAPGGAQTIRYIPGTTFMGALAAMHRLLYPKKEEQFERFFLREQVCYPNLYPATFKDEDIQNSGLPVYPVPKTAQSCKRHSGFMFPEKDNDGHGVRDSLIERALFALGSQPDYRLDDRELLDILGKHERCTYPGCGEGMDHFDGFYRRGAITTRLNDEELHPRFAAEVEGYTRLRTHTGIHRLTGTVQEGILYNRQVFEEGMRFFGTIRLPGDDELVTELRSFLSEVGSAELLHIGTGRSRGMGKVALSADPVEEQPDRFTAFRQRLDAFNTLMREQAAANHLHGLDDHFFFAITLHAPLILRDDLLRYRGMIDREALTAMCGHELPGLRLVYQAASVRRITGWQELWGMPRTNEYAIEMGSVFLFACSSPLNSADYRALFDLEENGAGRRRAEGFGRLCVSDQFHQEIVAR